MQKTEKGKVVWIDCARFLAIVAVLIDHTKGILYASEAVQHVFFFSVTVFFFLAGMTSFYSLQKRREEETVVGWVVRRLFRIIIPYLVAVAVCQYVRGGFTWSLWAYISWVIRFDLEGQFYFVLIYLQLILISPALYLITVYVGRGRLHLLRRGLYLAAVWILSVLCVQDTFILNTYGAGKYLFGGTYLFLFALGMTAAQMEKEKADLARRKDEKEEKKNAVLMLCLAVCCYTAALAFMLKDRFALDQRLFDWELRVNPPGITLCVYSLTILFLVRAFCNLMCHMKSRMLDRLAHAAAWLGGYTLYVFLYHMLILEGLLLNLPLPAALPRVARSALYLTTMVALPVAGKVLYDCVRRALMTGFSQKKPQSLP